MAVIGGAVGYQLLRRIGKKERIGPTQASRAGGDKLEMLLGHTIWHEIYGKSVVDYGCGAGGQAVAMAQSGAVRVIGIDIQERWLNLARERAVQAGVNDRCIFTSETTECADIVLCLDAFEHFSDPESALTAMHKLLKPTGSVLAAFGPTWYHPFGGHMFSIFPWAHLIFSEKALLRWRADFKTDGASRFGEVEGGLNQLTIAQFRRIVARSPFRFAKLETVPIRAAKWLANSLTEELTTSIVRCRLVSR